MLIVVLAVRSLTLPGAEEGVRFYLCLLYTSPFFMLYNYGAAILRAVGDTKRPLLFLVVAGVTNAVLNMILVILFHMGVEGVAIATVVSQLISCILVLRCLYKTESAYQLRFSRLTMKWAYLKQIFLVGIPAGIQSTVINFSNVLLQSSVNSFGSVAMAGYTAANNIFGFLYAAVNAVNPVSYTHLSWSQSETGTERSAETDTEYRDRNEVATGFEITEGAVEN